MLVSFMITAIVDFTRCQYWGKQMARAPLQPPTLFCFSKPDEWPKWKRRFEQYCMASGLSTKDV